ncbi:lipase from carbohydrate esterase family ce10 [Colletotrichum tofieldiae]|uniref:Lipase from carbohydrate esterase family ce10 n=1 Tax=Colletotrichum tofieldiae TaxID=708197 RepID=A0A166NZW4_9PEZI|nr:lipase from carbohydrate esterase family ce10 [Colletotrichum tofieldiae]GKT56535.1 lipase from carbohydrate esterase family ce10 [Colletotrichum tofieldiae]GKT76497.1 lipase from carbohydrate esterase family ce10 [Colletotrichum tofieldiae]
MAGEQTVHQPIHPSVRARLDPEYVALHDSIIQYMEPSEAQPWDPASRHKPNPLAHTTQKLSPVGKTWDEELGGGVQVRVFVPEGAAPEGGWPCLAWFHGGGWVNGGLDNENGFLTHVYVRCVVVTINYRHAPEHVYPAAVDDCLAGLKWIVEPANASRLNINTSLVTLGGVSAGGNLAAILTMKASLANVTPAPISQLLICPVIDSTATAETGWATSKHVPWLTPGRMAWYQDLYFSRPEDRTQWEASPCFAPTEVLARSPRTWLAVAEVDLLAPEGLKYAEQLRGAGVEVQTEVYKGATHSVLVLAGVHQISRKLVHDACAVLARGFGSTYDPSAAPILSQQE